MATINLVYPTSLHRIGISFESVDMEDARKFVEFMRTYAEINGKGPFYQGSFSKHDWERAEATTWEYFEYLHIAEDDQEGTDRTLELVFEAADYCGLEVG